MNILYPLFVSFFAFYSLFPSDFAFRENMMPKEEAEFVLSFLDPEIQSYPYRINAMDVTLRGSCNAAVFLGRPGGGKTDAMEAIAALLDKDWSVHRIKEADLHEKPGARGDSTYQFNRLLGAMRENRRSKNFIIMDELNGYLEHFNSEHHDTDSFARAFWDMLDEHLENPNYFLIGSVNEFDKVPQQVKDRLHDCIFEIDGFTSPEHFQACLVKIMNKASRFSVADGNNDYIIQRFTESGVQTARSTRSLMYSAFGRAASFVKDYDHIPVQREHIDSAIARRERIDVKIKYGQPVESDQERYHRENKEMNERHHEENKTIQEKQREIDNFRANYNTFLSIASTKASVASATIANHRQDILRNESYQIIDKGMYHMTRAMEMHEGFKVLQAANPVPYNPGPSCSIQ